MRPAGAVGVLVADGRDISLRIAVIVGRQGTGLLLSGQCVRLNGIVAGMLDIALAERALRRLLRIFGESKHGKRAQHQREHQKKGEGASEMSFHRAFSFIYSLIRAGPTGLML